MSQLVARTRSEAGQAIVLVAVAMAALVGMAALVIDGGSWFRAQRHLQTSADAAALAGAQALPNEWAKSVALDYAGLKYPDNYPGDFSADVMSVEVSPSRDVIDVHATATAHGILARIFGIDTVNIKAHAQAQVTVPASMKDVAPVAVKSTAACAVSDPTCYGRTVTVNFDESNIASSLIGLIDPKCHSSSSSLSGCDPGGVGADELRDWIEGGYTKDGLAVALPANQWYGVKTGQSPGPICEGFEFAANKRMTLFFPVWDESDAANRSFHVIGWSAFVIDPLTPGHGKPCSRDPLIWTSDEKKLTGHFVTYTATDLASGGTIGGATDYGVHVITLTQ